MQNKQVSISVTTSCLDISTWRIHGFNAKRNCTGGLSERNALPQVGTNIRIADLVKIATMLLKISFSGLDRHSRRHCPLKTSQLYTTKKEL